MVEQLMALCSLSKNNSSNKSPNEESVVIVVEREMKIRNILDVACKRWNHLTPSLLVVKYFASSQIMGRHVVALLEDDDVVKMFDLHKCLQSSVIHMLVVPKDMKGGTMLVVPKDMKGGTMYTAAFRGPKMDMSCEDCRKHSEHLYWDHMDVIGMQFVKPMVGDFSQHMMLPEKFICNFRELHKEVHLKGPIGNSWLVKLRSVDGTFLHSGWKEFVDANHIEEHDLLQFTYVGNFCFDIIVLDGSQCVKPVCYHAKTNVSMKWERSEGSESLNASSANIVTEHGSGSRSHVDVLQGQPIETPHGRNQNSGKGNQRIGSRSKYKKGNFKTRSCQVANGGHSASHISRKNRRRQNVCSMRPHEKGSLDNTKFKMLDHPNIFMSRYGRRIMDNAKKKKLLQLIRAVGLDNPCFATVMGSTSLGRMNFMRVPSEFRKVHLPARPCSFNLQVPGCQRKWIVDFNFGNTQKGFIGRWKYFTRDNNLQEGDICLFELVEPTEHAFTVYIGPAAQNGV